MKTFYDTLRIEETNCPAGCFVCKEKCIEAKRNMSPGCSGVIKTVHLPKVDFHTALTCNQCGEPACEESCPTGAITKSETDGVVRIDQAKCLGCGLCTMACPYGGIEYDAGTKRAFKCDMCDGDPQCVSACPHGVISLVRGRPVVQYLQEEQLISSGGPLCGGCPAELSLRFVMRIMGKDTFLFGAPGCIALLISGIGTRTLCRFASHLSNMTNLPSTAVGVKRYYRKMGKDVRCVCFAGDGCFADVGFQPLSGAAERGENIINICYDNQGYMNTGIQRSGTTPYKSWTTTTPVGEKIKGKQMPPKDVALIMAAHDIPYVATATIGYPEDFAKKLTKAAAVKDGMSYIHLLSPCPTGWRSNTDSAIEICWAAVQTNYFPLWEYERGEYRLTHNVEKPKPISDYLELMKRFSHLDEEDIKEFQHLVKKRFATIKSLTEMGRMEEDDLS